MTNITGNFESFNKYIHDSSAAIFSEESNGAHDWHREVRCSLSVDGVPCNLLIKQEASIGETQNFVFNFNLEFVALHTGIDKNKAKELICWIADTMRFHPNIKVLDHTEHSDKSGFCDTKVEPQGNNRYFWLQPKGFKHSTELQRYCWEGIPESADCWTSNMIVLVKLTPSISDCWGRSFDLGPEALDPSNLLRRAIRQRDERIAREAEQKAKEEIERQAAADKAEKERQEACEKAERELKEACDKLTTFLDSIGDFDINGVPFNGCWGLPDDTTILSLFRGDVYLNLDVLEDYDENVKKIIQWAVDNGASEPELKTEAA